MVTVDPQGRTHIQLLGSTVGHPLPCWPCSCWPWCLHHGAVCGGGSEEVLSPLFTHPWVWGRWDLAPSPHLCMEGV